MPRLTKTGRIAGAPCYVDDCGSTDIKGNGMCNRHYKRAYREANKERLLAQEAARRAANPEAFAAASARFKERNPDAAREATARSYAKHAEKRRAYARAYYAANREKAAATYQKWAQSNPSVVLDLTVKRRAGDAERLLVLDREVRVLRAAPCRYCGAPGPSTVDHAIPLERGGRHAIGNLVPACMPCNSSKGSRTIMEWRLVRH